MNIIHKLLCKLGIHKEERYTEYFIIKTYRKGKKAVTAKVEEDIVRCVWCNKKICDWNMYPL